MAKKIGNLSSLQFALSQLVDEPQQDDEFSVMDFVNEAKKTDPKMTYTIAKNRIRSMCENNTLTKRSIRRNGKMINIYKKA
jgi:hypothetical protein